MRPVKETTERQAVIATFIEYIGDDAFNADSLLAFVCQHFPQVFGTRSHQHYAHNLIRTMRESDRIERVKRGVYRVKTQLPTAPSQLYEQTPQFVLTPKPEPPAAVVTPAPRLQQELIDEARRRLMNAMHIIDTALEMLEEREQLIGDDLTAIELIRERGK